MRCATLGCRAPAVSHGYCRRHERFVWPTDVYEAWGMMKSGVSLNDAAWALGVRPSDLNVALDRYLGEPKNDVRPL